MVADRLTAPSLSSPQAAPGGFALLACPYPPAPALALLLAHRVALADGPCP